ncbi:MAG: hypothetical protein R3E98_17280 [Gemmatimonadota bacterium]|nr:hypothetical protein [Gemmatimonadota bacterium]
MRPICRLSALTGLATLLAAGCASTASTPEPGAAGLGVAAAPTTVAAPRAAPAGTPRTPVAHAPTSPSLDDPIVRLQRRLASGDVQLVYDSIRGWLPSLLAALDVPIESQGLIFSRTSLQTDRIAPWTPRAVYFNDDVYIGWVQESPILEIGAVDPDEGGAFYTLSQNPEGPPTFTRETTTCLMCHESRNVTFGVPGFMLLSVLADRHGYVITNVHDGPTTERTPIDARWGGWYVTGSAGNTTHAGNAMAPDLHHEVGDRARYLAQQDLTSEAHVTSLEGRFDTTPYLSEHSDIVALLVLAHQARIHNLIALAAQESATALREQEYLLRTTGEAPPTDGLTPATRMRIDGAVDRLVRAMFFVGEVPLGGPVVGTSGFAEMFATRGPHDSQGRSLRDLDLGNRVFRYPLSFLIHSDAFLALPDAVRRRAYDRVRAVLTGEDRSGDYQHLSADDRAAILEILTETQPDFVALTVE